MEKSKDKSVRGNWHVNKSHKLKVSKLAKKMNVPESFIIRELIDNLKA